MDYIIEVIIVIFCIVLSLITANAKIACFILGAGLVSVCAISVFMYFKRERQISDIIFYLTRLQDDLKLPELKKYGEGQIGILQNEVYKLVKILNRRSDCAIDERGYLSKMLSDISHQIKTPLTSVSIMTELLKSPDISEEQRIDFARKIDHQLSKITWLVKNLLSLSKLEAGVLKLKKETISAGELIDKVVQQFEIITEVKEITIEKKIADVEIICDINWTVEALTNIVKNCIEHTAPCGIISFSVEQNNLSTVIRIKDTGAGISKEHLPHIFDRFYTVDSSAKDSVGIGLALAKEVIMLQKGVINVSSEEGVGTEFSIKLYS